MNFARIAIATAALALLLGSAGLYLDGPTELDAARATAAAARDVERVGLFDDRAEARPLSHPTEGQP